jgi:16S rRNA (guanine527-N7)-methyltransferase
VIWASPENGAVADADLPARLRGRLEHFGAPLSTAQVDQLAAYVGLLTKWNRTLNLTALELEPLSDAAIDRLIVEPVIAAGAILDSDRRLVDLGTGGGSPAIPLKVAVPRLQLTMVESRERKSAFLREATRVLGLADTTVQTVRIEDFRQGQSGEAAADVVSVRAVKLDSGTWMAVADLVQIGGRLLWFRSRGESADDPGGQRFTLESATPLIPSTNSELAVFRRVQ